MGAYLFTTIWYYYGQVPYWLLCRVFHVQWHKATAAVISTQYLKYNYFALMRAFFMEHQHE